MAYSSSGASQRKYVIFLCLLLILGGLMCVASKQMADNVPQIKYDVFVSFRGEDIRHAFLGHLTEAFRRKQTLAFVDDKLEKGHEIWPSLVGAIQGSSISLTIFSGNYASSRWCLEELVTILECREKYNQTVVPVFYNVYPTDVRHQTGSYENAFVEHEKKYNLTTVKKWRHALKKAADLSGIKSLDYKTEVELLGEIINIVNFVLMNLDKHPLNLKGIIGIDKPIQQLESKLHEESKYVLVIGIWGMGGIGKTTIAKEIFSKQYSEYDGYYFLENVKEELRRYGTISLKEKLFSTLLGENVKMNMPGMSNYIKRRIDRMKVLIVLDDVNDSDVQEILFQNNDWFGQGSRIIITTRDKQVLVSNKVDYIYHVRELNSSDALELFSFYAFKKYHFDMEYYELSKRVVNYAKGIPLVLKVLGRLVCGKDYEVWESQLNKLKNMPNTDVYNVMKLSYDDLDWKEQKILLDLAFFFIGLNVKVDRIKFLLRDSERDDSVVVGLERLKDKALITISKDNVISMHDIIQEMAWEIVRHESIEDPGKRSRLRDPDDIYELLKNNKGTEAIRSIRADLSVFMKLKLSPQVFTKMSKLQFLYFSSKCDQDGFSLLPHGLQSFPVELRYLAWKGYPLKFLPENFSPKNLVILDLSDSQVEKLWDGVQNLMNLKEVKVSGSRNLMELPDLSKAINLEVLEIRSWYCLTPSISSLNKLERLDIAFSTLAKFTSENHLSLHSYLNIQSFKKMREFSEKAFPSFVRQRINVFLKLGCDIQSLPSSFMNLTRLRYLNVKWSMRLHTLPELPPSLEFLDATNCRSLKTVLFPSITEQFKENRRDVRFWNCLKLDHHFLKAIELNARINVMKFAYQHLSAQDENYDDYNCNYGSYQSKYVYPGSSVPEWFEYQTTEDYIIIDLSSTPPCTHMGFIFSFVISSERNSILHYKYSFNITISDDEDESRKDSINIHLSDSILSVGSDHMCVVYDQRCSRYLHSRAENQIRLKIKVTLIEGYLSKSSPLDVLGTLELKGFGISLINTTAYLNFIQQINTSAYHSFIQQINSASAGHISFLEFELIYDMLILVITITIIIMSWLLFPFKLRWKFD